MVSTVAMIPNFLDVCALKLLDDVLSTGHFLVMEDGKANTGC